MVARALVWLGWRCLLLLLLMLAPLTTSAGGPNKPEPKQSVSALNVVAAELDLFDPGELEALLAKRSPDDASPIIDPYTGPLREHREVKDFIASIDSLHAEAIKQQRALLGIGPDFAANIYVTVADRGSKHGDTNDMEATSRRIKGQWIGVVTVFAGALVSRRSDAERSFVHEVNHALLREYLGAGYLKLPVWFREGVALHGAGQTDARVATLLAGQVYDCIRFARKAGDSTSIDFKAAERIVDDLCNGLEDAHGYPDYAESALTIRFLEETTPGALVQIVAKLKQGTDLRAAIAEVHGATFEAFSAAANAYARNVCSKLVGTEAMDFLKRFEPLILAIYGTEKPTDEVLRNAVAWRVKAVMTRRASFLHGMMSFFVARGHIAREAWAEASSVLYDGLEVNRSLRHGTLTVLSLKYLATAALQADELVRAREYALRLKFGADYGERWVRDADALLDTITAKEAALASAEKGDGAGSGAGKEEPRRDPDGKADQR